MVYPTWTKWGPPIVWIILIFWQSSIPQVPGAGLGQQLVGTSFSNFGHVAEYLILALLLGIAVGPGRGLVRSILAIIVIATLLGLLDEIHQIWIPGRNPSFADVCFDSFGGILGTLGWLALMRILPRYFAQSSDV